jgi:protein involved in polysaccharide export with SLBB domain
MPNYGTEYGRRNGRFRGLTSACFAALVTLLSTSTVQAQLSPDQLQQLQQSVQQRQGGNTAADSTQAAQPQSIQLQPAVPANAGNPLNPAVPAAAAANQSRLEYILSQRAGANLVQFGYDQLGQGRSVTVPLVGAVQDDYVLGPGDEIIVSLRGQENGEYRATVDRNGQVVLPRLAPLSATGRTFGSFRADLDAAVHRSYVATNASVSIGRVRQISVLVSGEVNDPGQRLLTGLSSAVDALLLSGGVKKTGTLRSIRIVRAGRTYNVDLYSVLTDRGGDNSMRLADGDRILVPRLGTTVAVTGLVRQPGIYELQPGASSMSVRALTALAGGTEVRGLYNNSILRILPDGRTDMTPADQNAQVRGSEVLFVQFGADQTTNQVTLAGGTGLAGAYPINSGTRLSDVLKAPGALGTAPYTLFGVISRRDPKTLLRNLVDFTPMAVIAGKEDLVLKSDDIVRVFSVAEARLLVTTMQQFSRQQQASEEALRNPSSVVSSGNDGNGSNGGNSRSLTGQAALQSANVSGAQGTSQQQTIAALASRPGEQGGGASSVAPRAVAENLQTASPADNRYATNREATTFNQIAEQLGVDTLAFTKFLGDHQVTLNGAIRGSGVYLAGPSVLLEDLIQAAGGTDHWTDESSVELISTTVSPAVGQSATQVTRQPLRQGLLTSYYVRPHDEFRFNRIFTDNDVGSVTVQGEVRTPGQFKLVRGERLSDLLSRAGGLTNTAYPYGTVFLRKSVALVEREGYLRTANDVENQLVVAMTRVGSDKILPETFTAMQGFVNDLRNQTALGRISVTADPSVLAGKPELDMLLEAGDVIYIPPRPGTISVLGQVMQVGSYPYRPGTSLRDYIQQAGGFDATADSSRMFVVLPDGSARRVETSWLSFGDNPSLPPGSSIVVPRDITPLEMRQTIIDVTQILSQIAVTLASLAVLSKQ